MKLKEIATRFKADVFDTVPNEILSSETNDWKFYSWVSVNGLIAIGWLSDDSILAINGDGTFIYDINQKAVVYEDYETPFYIHISEDNLKFFLQVRNETVNIFGIRGGGGNLLTKDNVWKIELAPIAWNIRIPKLINYKSGSVHFVELYQNNYEGDKYLGFSKSEKYFVIMGDSGIDIYLRK